MRRELRFYLDITSLSFESTIIKIQKNRMSVLKNCGRSQLKFWIRIPSYLIIKIMLTHKNKHERKYLSLDSLQWNFHPEIVQLWKIYNLLGFFYMLIFHLTKIYMFIFHLTEVLSLSSSKTWLGEQILISYYTVEGL